MPTTLRAASGARHHAGASRAIRALVALATMLIATSASAAAPGGDHCRTRWQAAQVRPMSVSYLDGQRAPGVIAGEEPLTIAAQSDAMVDAVLVRPGDLVVAGQPLMRLSSETLAHELAMQLREIEVARQDVVKLRERAKSIASNLQRYRRYPDLFAKSEIDSLQADGVSADAEVLQSQLRLQQIELKQASLARERNGLAVNAPRAGHVRQLAVRAGMRVSAGAALAELGGDGGKRLRFALPAAAAASFASGATLCVVVPGRRWVAAVRIERPYRWMLDAGETVAIETDIGAAAVWPVGMAVDVLPPEPPR